MVLSMAAVSLSYPLETSINQGESGSGEAESTVRYMIRGIFWHVRILLTAVTASCRIEQNRLL